MKEKKRKEKKRKEKTTPFGVNLTRSLVIYQAAQTNRHACIVKLWLAPAQSIKQPLCWAAVVNINSSNPVADSYKTVLVSLTLTYATMFAS